MKIEEAAFMNLVALARADGLTSQAELAAIERHREALGLSKEFADEILQKDKLDALAAGEIKGKPGDRKQILKMMIRVAYADGGLSSREKRLLKRVALSFGLGRIELKGLFFEIEQELGVKRRLRFSQTALVLVIVVSAAAVFFIYKHFSSETEQRWDETRIDLDELKAELGLEREEAVEALLKVRRSQDSLTRNESTLAERLIELEKKSAEERSALKDALTTEHQNQQARMQAEIERLRSELSRVRSLNAVFKEIEKEYGKSILLIFTTYDLVLDKQRVTQGSMGSGFFVSSTGHIVTNKHVVNPWKFSGDSVMLMDRGFTIDQASLLLAAWPAGAEIKTAQGGLNIDGAYSTAAGTLEQEKITPDTFETRMEMLSMGMTYQGDFHTIDNGDLALLKAVTASPVRPIPLAGAGDRLAKLDPVMVLGFPTGINILESTTAETSPSLGEVRKIETSIMVTAPIVSGNSGGPLIDARGNVVGVASKIFGEATLGSCIPTEYILPLLPAASDLLENILVLEASDAYRAALDDLRLAGRRTTDAKMLETAGEIRARLLTIRDEMLVEAEKAEGRDSKRKAYQEIANRFGPVWGRQALELLRGL